ncbi:uracil-DNA glycosylase [Candidatus Parcubacteria bacterium]|nr:uracil-DNA glycosylase [Candidatus Parcubacteria bacterium]
MKQVHPTTPEELARVHKALKRKFQDKKLIFGSGSVPAKVVVVSEMPGPDEERESKPLTGHNEKLLNQVLKSVGIDRKKVYITNVVKYSPQPGKMPSPKEIKSYLPFLKEEIKTINPQVVITLGNIALNGIGLRQPLDNIHGKTFNFGSFELLPTYHPSHALKNPEIKAVMQTDLAKIKEILKRVPKPE